ERILGHHRRARAEVFDESRQARPIESEVAAERDASRSVPPSADEVHRQGAHRHRARLPHPSLVEPHEVGVLAVEAREVDLFAANQARDDCGHVVEIALHYRTRSQAPPNTSTCANTHAGEACPTAIA